MLNVEFPGSFQVSKPADMTDEQCAPAWAYHGIDANQVPFFLMAYQPSKEDLEALNAGRPLYLQICGRQLAPHALFTLDEKDEANV